jgi:hypothetical protein
MRCHAFRRASELLDVLFQVSFQGLQLWPAVSAVSQVYVPHLALRPDALQRH